MVQNLLYALIGGLGGTFLLFLFVTNVKVDEMKAYKKFIKRNWVLILKVLLICVTILFLPYIFAQANILQATDTSTASSDGFNNVTAPFIGICVGILTFLAFFIQYKANEQQKKDLRIERFENKFYKMLELHKSNVDEMNIRNEIYGRKCFIPMFTELQMVYKIVFHYHEVQKEFSDNFLTLEEAMDLSYNIFFYGIGSNSEKQYFDRLSENQKVVFVVVKIYLRKIQKTRRENLEKVKFTDEIPNSTVLGQIYLNTLKLKYGPFEGHANRLGHYYRHLLQTLQFINSNRKLTKKQKYSYAKTLRAQLSNFEQLHIYYNAMAWFIDQWRPLIVKFHFLKNLPVGLADFHKTPLEEFREEIRETNEKGNCLFEAYQTQKN